MKKSFRFITAIAAFRRLIGVGGSGTRIHGDGRSVRRESHRALRRRHYTGTLSGLFDTVSHKALYINSGAPSSDMYANQDYVVATSSSGAKATFSVGEITVGNNAVSGQPSPLSSINITGNSSTGYTVTGPGRRFPT